MPEFTYRGRDPEGSVRTGSIEASSQDAAITEVFNLGVTPIEVRPASSSRSLADIDIQQLFGTVFEPKVKIDDLITFVRQLHALLQAGVPVIRALRGLGENTNNPRLSRALYDVANGLESGQALSEAMNQHPDVFPNLLRAMVRVGEDSGQLEESLQRMAQSLEQERNTRENIKQALRYPTFVFIAIAIALVVLNVFVIPTFADVFEKFDAELPLFTRILMGISAFFVDYWLHLLLATIGLLVAGRFYLRSERGRLWWDRLKLRLPIIGSIMLRALLARFARTFAMSLRSGVPILEAIRSVAESTDNAYISQGIYGLREGIERGEGLYDVCERSGLFTPLVLQMLAVGEETGQVSDMMDQVGSFYEREVQVDLNNLSSSIEPIVISFIGVLVLVLALGIFLPMWQMGAQAL